MNRILLIHLHRVVSCPFLQRLGRVSGMVVCEGMYQFRSGNCLSEGIDAIAEWGNVDQWAAAEGAR